MLARRPPPALRRPISLSPRIPRRTFISRRRQVGNGRAVEGLNLERMAKEREEYAQTRRTFLAAGAVAGVISCIYTAWKIKKALESNPTRLDSALPPTDPLVAGEGVKRKVVVHDDDGREMVRTGNSTVPEFPRTIELPASSAPTEASVSVSVSAGATAATTTTTTEYTLVGLGLRTVSFLSIQVYVVGYYIATSDIAAFQSRLVKKINPIATTLVPGEKDKLRQALLDPAEGEAIWEELLRESIPARSVFRVVPVRDTDFHHLRDGFVRAIQARAAGSDGLGESMREFRQLFNRGKVPKTRELLLIRDGRGDLTVVYDDGRSAGRQYLGTVKDERISRALWLNWVAGRKVASEAARSNIVEGVMEFVERPIGTVAAQVV